MRGFVDDTHVTFLDFVGHIEISYVYMPSSFGT